MVAHECETFLNFSNILFLSIYLFIYLFIYYSIFYSLYILLIILVLFFGISPFHFFHKKNLIKTKYFFLEKPPETYRGSEAYNVNIY